MYQKPLSACNLEKCMIINPDKFDGWEKDHWKNLVLSNKVFR